MHDAMSVRYMNDVVCCDDSPGKHASKVEDSKIEAGSARDASPGEQETRWKARSTSKRVGSASDASPGEQETRWKARSTSACPQEEGTAMCNPQEEGSVRVCPREEGSACPQEEGSVCPREENTSPGAHL